VGGFVQRSSKGRDRRGYQPRRISEQLSVRRHPAEEAVLVDERYGWVHGEMTT